MPIGIDPGVRRVKKIYNRLATFFLVAIATITGFYASLVFSSASLTPEQRLLTFEAIAVLEERGFRDEAFLLRKVVVFRSNDNWLNASVEKEDAYAATNFPFAIITLYPEFFDHPVGSIERAAILLHEARHVRGEDEPAAYEYVWKNRTKLGWTEDKFGASEVWRTVENQTRFYVPGLFICEFNPGSDCTAIRKPPTVSHRRYLR